MSRGGRRGLTPSETLLIAAIVAAVALAAAWRFVGDSGEQSRRVTIERLSALSDGLESYAIDNGARFPTTDQGLNALVQSPSTEPIPIRWQGPYVKDTTMLSDAWGVPFNYVAPGGSGRPYDLWSNGADRAEGGDGANADVQSWQRSTLVP